MRGCWESLFPPIPPLFGKNCCGNTVEHLFVRAQFILCTQTQVNVFNAPSVQVCYCATSKCNGRCLTTRYANGTCAVPPIYHKPNHNTSNREWEHWCVLLVSQVVHAAGPDVQNDMPPCSPTSCFQWLNAGYNTSGSGAKCPRVEHVCP
jgi:hypothetical protein